MSAVLWTILAIMLGTFRVGWSQGEDTPVNSYFKLCEDICSSLSEYWESVARYFLPWQDSDNKESDGDDDAKTTIEAVDMTRSVEPMAPPLRLVTGDTSTQTQEATIK